MMYNPKGLKGKLLTYLKDQYPRWVHKGTLERESQGWGYLADNAARRCRELTRTGWLERELNENREVMYRYNKESHSEPYVKPQTHSYKEQSFTYCHETHCS